MKKLLLFLILIAMPVHAIETAVIGTMWKQKGTVVSPADDVTEVTGVGISEGSDVGFGNMTATSLNVSQGTVSNLSIGFGDGDTGFFEVNDDYLDMVVLGISEWRLSNVTLQGTTSGNPALYHSRTGSYTLPEYSFNGDGNTGLSRGAEDQVSLIAGGVEVLRSYTTYSEFYPAGSGQVRIYDNGNLDVEGAVAFSGMSSITADYTIGNFADDPTYFIECDAALGNISTTLPPVANKKGRLVEIKLLSATNGCYIDGNGAETIDGAAGQAITTQYNVISLIAGATKWLIR
ncbi:hypothetical protein KAR91_64505 [Candidatus Pacearchaeota archaeon]|nr:hypothetical protein [Candidatus Pacearchaeota archaeon]